MELQIKSNLKRNNGPGMRAGEAFYSELVSTVPCSATVAGPVISSLTGYATRSPGRPCPPEPLQALPVALQRLATHVHAIDLQEIERTRTAVACPSTRHCPQAARRALPQSE